MLPFVRSDLAQFVAYTPHPGGAEGAESAVQLDRLDTNECPYDLPEKLKQKLAWEFQQAIASNRYPDGEHLALKQGLVEAIAESSLSPFSPTSTEPSTDSSTDWLTPAYLSISSGSDELIRSVLIATCLNGAGSILVADPTFSMYAITARTLGIPVISVGRSASFEIDLAAAAGAIAQSTQPPIRVVFVVHPNSPTGNALTEAELHWICSIPEDILVVIDEAYFEFSGRTVLPKLPQYPNWIVLRTFSKAFRLAAHRVGYGIAHPELIAMLEKIRLPYNLPTVSLVMAELAIAHRTQLLSAIPEILAERQRLYQAIQHLSKDWSGSLALYPSDANFLFLRFQEATPDAATAQLDHVFQTLKTKGTLVRKTCGGLRITIGTPGENERTLTRLREILLG